MGNFLDSLPGILSLLIPIFALSIPVVKILTRHQKEMAEILARQHAQPQIAPVTSQESSQTREELRLLREQLNQQSLLLAELKNQNQNLQERVSDSE